MNRHYRVYLDGCHVDTVEMPRELTRPQVVEALASAGHPGAVIEEVFPVEEETIEIPCRSCGAEELGSNAATCGECQYDRQQQEQDVHTAWLMSRSPSDDAADRLRTWVSLAQHEASRVLETLREGDHCGSVVLSGEELVEVRRRLEVILGTAHEAREVAP